MPFGAIKQIDAGVLNVGYVDLGPREGPAVMLLHGWPYDIHSYVDVAPTLASRGYRVIVPYVRGYGSTRFLSDDTMQEWPAVGARRGHARPDGRAANRPGDRRGLRLGGTDRLRDGRALARALQGTRLGQRLHHRQPREESATAATRGGAGLVVPVLLRHRTGPAGLRQEPARIRKAHLEERFPEMGIRRCDLRPQRPGVR